MKQKVDISVIVASYFHEAYIAECLDSILAQETDLCYEILVGDDASQDKTPEIICDYARRYPDKIRPFLRTKNVGATRNNLALIENARGKYIAQLDGDDYWVNQHKLQRQWEFLEQHPEYSGCCGRCLVVDENGQADYTQSPRFVVNQKVFTLDHYIDIWKLPGQAGTLMYRNIPERRLPIFYQIHRNVGDKTFYLILLSKGPIYCDMEILSCYRRVDKSDGHNWFSIHHANSYRNYDMFMYPCRLETWARKNMGLPPGKHLGKQNAYRFCRFVEELVREPSLKRVRCLAQMVVCSHQPAKYSWLVLKTLIEMESWLGSVQNSNQRSVEK